MFRRGKTRIAPLQVDEYVRRRYEDLAVCIAQDLASDRGLFCYYTPWLEYMMGKFNLPGNYRMKHSLVAKDSQGRHIGCSGAAKNTLVYYNPISFDCESRVQFEEAVQKSSLSAKLSGISQRNSEERRGEDCDKETSNGLICSKARHCPLSDDVGGDKTINCSVHSSTMHKHFCNAVVIEVKPAEDILFDSEPCPVIQTPVNAEQHQDKEEQQPQYVDEDGVVHVDSELEPQSEEMDSYYARIDEAFRKHRAEISKPDEQVRTSHVSISSRQTCAVELNSYGARGRVRSKICTIL